MPRRSAQLPSISAKVRGATNAQNRAEIELGEIEREIKENRDRPLSIVLKGVIDRVRRWLCPSRHKVLFWGWWRYSPLELPPSTRRTLRHCSISPAYSFRCSSPRNQRTSKSEWEKDAPGPPLPERPFFWLCSCCCLSFTTGQRRRTLPLPIRPLPVRPHPPRRRQYREKRELPKPEKRRASRPLMVHVLFRLPRHPHLRPLSLSSRVPDRPDRLRRHQVRSRWGLKISPQRSSPQRL